MLIKPYQGLLVLAFKGREVLVIKASHIILYFFGVCHLEQA